MDSFSIITPSFRSLAWLPLCVASVADQEGVNVEHLVQDGGSDDGTVNWLKAHPQVKSVSAPDAGMYDAINRGLRRANGQILAHLNADEQYLPGALAAVSRCFTESPELDVVLADTVVVDDAGQFICCRKSTQPRASFLWAHNPTITSSIFFHRRVIEQHQLFFDPKWRILGDAVWLRTALQKRLRFAVLRQYTSTFTDTGDNLYFSPKAVTESQQLREQRPRWVSASLPLLRWAARFDRGRQGATWQRPFRYSLYTQKSPRHRVEHFVSNPTTVWWNRSSRGSSTFVQKMRRLYARRTDPAEI
jgi:glycosyltransferase involved in cell wall biosynthesis